MRGEGVVKYKGYKIFKNGTILNKDGSLKKLGENSNGYLVADLYENGKRERVLVHRLIAKLFIPNTKNRPVVNHIDGNKHNNHYKNLQWTTHSENNKHAYRAGLKKPIKNPKFNAKLSVDDVRKIKLMLLNGEQTKAAIGRKFGVTKTTICYISKGKAWKDVL
jgi:hypothetical protein